MVGIDLVKSSDYGGEFYSIKISLEIRLVTLKGNWLHGSVVLNEMINMFNLSICPYIIIGFFFSLILI